MEVRRCMRVRIGMRMRVCGRLRVYDRERERINGCPRRQEGGRMEQ